MTDGLFKKLSLEQQSAALAFDGNPDFGPPRTDLTKARSELRRLKLGDEIDAVFVSTILDAARTGDLIPRAVADLAVALMVEKAAGEGAGEVAAHGASELSPFVRRRIRALTPASALSELQVLRDELHLIKTAGIIEVAVRNPSVFDYMQHWEGRAEAAEAELVTLRAQVERLTGALTIAANRLHRCSVDYDTGTREFIEVGGWADEARAALTEGAAP